MTTTVPPKFHSQGYERDSPTGNTTYRYVLSPEEIAAQNETIITNRTIFHSFAQPRSAYGLRFIRYFFSGPLPFCLATLMVVNTLSAT